MILSHEDHFKAKSPLQWMVEVYLREVYQIFIEPKARGKKYVAFAHQALKELKIKDGNAAYSLESVARAARGYERGKKFAPRVDQAEWDFDRKRQLCAACGLDAKLDPAIEMRKREQALR